MADFIENAPLSAVDPEILRIIDLEKERQSRKLIFIPSESMAAVSVRESMGSILQNIYAEGYPEEETRLFSEDQILDVDKQVTYFQRYSDPRYYKGVEYADILEELARRRCAELFATRKIPADDFFVNVQPLSGAPANNAVYSALVNPGDVIVGMNLFHGGHLTHGSSVNRSGKLYDVHHYSVDSETEKIDYAAVRALVEEKQPKILIAGYSSYPWVPDWKEFADIAHSVGAYLFTDISHIAGMIAAGVMESPVGYADVITFTTHKTLCGPRGACIVTFDRALSRKIDKAVFPGEQGGPHIQVFAAMATAYKLAKTKNFKAFQSQILKNAVTLANHLRERGIRLAFEGTNTHLFNVDCKSIKGTDGTQLSGDMAVRILDIAGLVMNANTIPGDTSALRSTGIRIGTPWITQRGLVEKDMVEIGDIIADVLFATNPYSVMGKTRPIIRAKVDFEVLEKAKLRVRDIVKRTVDGEGDLLTGYPNIYHIDDFGERDQDTFITVDLSGDRIKEALQYILHLDVTMLKSGQTQKSTFWVNGKEVDCLVMKSSDNTYKIGVQGENAGEAITWLRDLSSGYIAFDSDLHRKIPGPFVVKESKEGIDKSSIHTNNDANQTKPFIIGSGNGDSMPVKKTPFSWSEDSKAASQRTALYDLHVESGARIIPFAGWEMPVWYTSVTDEHLAVRNAAGLFDVSHMGVFEASGADAGMFLNYVCGNDIGELAVGESCYTHFLDPNADVIDDLLIYHHARNHYLIVVNAANKEKDWAWLNGVLNSEIVIDSSRPWVEIPVNDVTLRNLHEDSAGQDQRVDIALQGPKSREILLKIGFSKTDRDKILALKRTELCHAEWQGKDLIISRTGYTGEKIAFEIFLHPGHSVDLWKTLIEKGSSFGLLPCGLGARDSLRTEAGLPLYGYEMGGEFNLGAADAGFGVFVKTHKPWFIGRDAFMKHEAKRTHEVRRFRFEAQRTKIAHLGDPVFDSKGRKIGFVTSCAIDRHGFLTGLAYVEKSRTRAGTDIFIYQKSEKIDEITLQDLPLGKKIPLPEKAVVLKRFPKL